MRQERKRFVFRGDCPILGLIAKKKEGKALCQGNLLAGNEKKRKKKLVILVMTQIIILIRGEKKKKKRGDILKFPF